MPNLTDDQLRYYQNRETVANFADSLYNDPSLSPELKRLIKRKYPDVSIPDLDIETRINQRFDEDKREREEREKAERTAAQEREWREKRERVIKDFSLTEDGIKKVEDIMVERGIADYEVAASYVASKEPKPTSPGDDVDDRMWHHGQSDQFKEIAKDPEGWAKKEILQAIRNDQARSRAA